MIIVRVSVSVRVSVTVRVRVSLNVTVSVRVRVSAIVRTSLTFSINIYLIKGLFVGPNFFFKLKKFYTRVVIFLINFFINKTHHNKKLNKNALYSPNIK